MALFNKSQKQMVLDLIIAENPALAGVTLDMIEFVGTPRTVSGALTEVAIRGKRGAGFTGITRVRYNRIHLGTLFFSMRLNIQQYNAATSLDLIDAINARYGMNFLASEMVSYAIPSNATTAQVNIAPTANSLAYYGAATCYWTKGNQQLTDYYPKRTLTSLSVPDVMLKAFQLDFSSMLSTLQAHDTTVAFSSASSTAQAIVDALKAKVGLPLILGATTTPGSDPYDLSGFTLSFSTPDVLQDSNPGYRKIAVLSPPAVFGNQYTPIYLHYDKIPVFTKTKTADLISVTEMNGLQAPTK